MTVGLRDFYIAPITIEDGVEKYGTPRKIAKAIKVDMSVNLAEAILYADDAAAEIVKEFVDGSIKFNGDEISDKDEAEILGQKTDEDGVVFGNGDDEPPYYAIGFRATKTGGRFKYMWLYKAQFKPMDESYETKGDGINFQTPTIEATFVKREKDGNWKANVTAKATDEVAVGWFKAVREPNFADDAA